MSYKVEFKEEAKMDLKSFSYSQNILVAKQLKKLSISPELGKPLGNKMAITYLDAEKCMWIINA